jgi:hypothetical protein
MSGRWDPPAEGWLERITSFGFQLSPRCFIYHFTASCIDPRCTGKWGALATREPSGAKRAQEKSNLSLILVEHEVFCKVRPIYSAIDINRLPKIDNKIGSLFIFSSFTSWVSDSLIILRFPCLVTVQIQLDSISMVLV